MWNNCKYATPLCFYRVNCIFFGFRAFYRFFSQFFAVILQSHSALGSQWLITFVVADFAKGFRHAEIKRSIAPPLPIRAKLFGGPQ